MYINRKLEKQIKSDLFGKRAIFIFGARQVGKTTMVRQIIKETGLEAKFFTGDLLEDRKLLQPKSVEYLKRIYNGAKIIVIDEAHKFEGIDDLIKTTVDLLPDIQIIATGSSAFWLKHKTKDSLAGRKWNYNLYPLSFDELSDNYGFAEELKNLETRLLYGSYPEVVLNENKERILQELIESYLFKDILEWEGIKKSQKLEKLLIALALQIGSQVKYRELGSLVGLDAATVEKYINILEQSFIIFRLPSYSKNLRNELKYSRKIYFWDLGIRNALINDFKALNYRTDTGALWENYFIAERIKFAYNNGRNTKFYFWRTQQAQEVDLIEITQNQTTAFEIKFNTKKKARIPKTFINAYPEAEVKIINPENFWEVLN